MSAFIAPLASRAVVRIAGGEAADFLHNLVTCDIEALEPDKARFGALLTPQGKILFDFLIQRRGDGYYIDLPAQLAPDFLKRINLYKLRAKVEVDDFSQTHRVYALWSDGAAAAGGSGMTRPAGSFADPRHCGLGLRLIKSDADVLPEGFAAAAESDWHANRIALGVPEGGIDFEYAQAFPHDADMDFLSGIAFDKGCFVGQEVVSRMRHRGTARRRIVSVTSVTALPAPGTRISAGEKAAGTLGSVDGLRGLALVRIDRIGAALRAGDAITAGDVAITPAIPAWAGFDWPTGDAPRADASQADAPQADT